MQYAIINPDLTVLVCPRPWTKSGGWETPPFPSHWQARAWANAQGYTVLDSNLPTWSELCEA